MHQVGLFDTLVLEFSLPLCLSSTFDMLILKLQCILIGAHEVSCLIMDYESKGK